MQKNPKTSERATRKKLIPAIPVTEPQSVPIETEDLSAALSEFVADEHTIARTCYHEAGHAVVFWALTGLTVDSIVIGADGSGAVHTGRVERDLPSPLAGQRLGIFSAAGCGAMLRFEDPDCLSMSDTQRSSGVWDWLMEGDWGDEKSDLAIVQSVCRTEAGLGAIIKRANILIDRHWATIERLANYLIRRTQQADFLSVSVPWIETDPLVRDDLTAEDLADLASRRAALRLDEPG